MKLWVLLGVCLLLLYLRPRIRERLEPTDRMIMYRFVVRVAGAS